MPKLPCPCGYVHHTGMMPDAAWLTVRDADMEAFLAHSRLYEDGFNAPVGEPERAASDESGAKMMGMQGRLYECPECGVILWRPHRGGEYRAFRPMVEDG
jgi:hypothetical protein